MSKSMLNKILSPLFLPKFILAFWPKNFPISRFKSTEPVFWITVRSAFFQSSSFKGAAYLSRVRRSSVSSVSAC
jgi:hypothetical protein